MNDSVYAAVYARYSEGSHQTDQSIDGQLAEAHKYAVAHGMKIISEYCDRRISGRTDERPEFRRMLHDSAKGEWTALITWKNDRLGRDRYELAMNKHALRKNGITICYVAEQIPDTPEGVILEGLLESMAEYYSLQLSTNVRRGLRESVKKSKRIGPLPYGYVTGADKVIAADPFASAVVRQIFTDYAGGKPMKEICDGLMSAGIRATGGAPWTVNKLTALLKNRKYIGEYSIRGEVIGSIPALVDQAIFDKVQEMMVRNRRAPKKEWTSTEYLLTGKLFCGHCESPMVGVSGTGRRGGVYHYYDCMGHRKHTCTKKPVRKEWIENRVLDQVRQVLFDDDLLEQIADGAWKLYESEVDTSYIDGLRAQLKEVEKGIEGILDAIQAGLFHPSMKERMAELTARQDELNESLASARVDEEIPLSRDMILFFLTQLRERDTEDPEDRRWLIETFVNSIYLYDDKIVITFNYSGPGRRVTLQEIDSASPGSYSSLQGVPEMQTSHSGWLHFLFPRQGSPMVASLFV